MTFILLLDIASLLSEEERKGVKKMPETHITDLLFYRVNLIVYSYTKLSIQIKPEYIGNNPLIWSIN